VNFKDGVDQTPELNSTWREGLQALQGSDKQHIKVRTARRLTGSVNVDVALREKYPEENRWDYAIGHQPTNLKGEIVYWVEVHPATDGQIKVVLAKLQWLKTWLGNNAKQLQSMRKEFIWVSSGKTSFTLTSPQQKQFALKGLQHKGRVFMIADEAGA
jgi:hypothetical protein